MRIAIANPKSSSTAMLHLIKLALTVDMKLCRETYSGYKTIIDPFNTILVQRLVQFNHKCTTNYRLLNDLILIFVESLHSAEKIIKRLKVQVYLKII